MLVLVETPAGFGLFRVRDRKLLEIEDATELNNVFASAASAQQAVELAAFAQFRDTQQAVEEALQIAESRLSKTLKKFLRRNAVKQQEDEAAVAVSALLQQEPLAVGDRALGIAIKKKLGIEVVFSPATHEIIRGIRDHLATLLEGFSEKDRQMMAVSLAHSLNRFKLKFSPDKVDTMIIQAVALLDDLDRELNNFSMRLKEWYGWHFPELSKIVSDNLLYAKAVQRIGFRSNTKNVDLSTLLPVDIVAEVKMAAETSMGTEITGEDLLHINTLAARVEELVEYRANLAEYLKLRMKAVAPNLTYMVGEVIGARLMAHAGSLLNLSKQPASTIQILGAEKALFRALKTKSHTPKYGLLFHAALVGQAPPKLKGKISRVLAAKLSLCVRVDALTEATESAAAAAGMKLEATSDALQHGEPSVAVPCRRYVEVKLLQLEQQQQNKLAHPSAKPPLTRYEPKRSAEVPRAYDASTDVVENVASSTSGVPEEVKRHKHSREENESQLNGPNEGVKPKKKKKTKD